MAMAEDSRHIETSFLPQYKALSSYTIPKIDVAVSGTFTSKPGIC
jgi:hypothetical protein